MSDRGVACPTLLRMVLEPSHDERCLACGQFVPRGAAEGPRCQHCGQLAPCGCDGDPNRVRQILAMTVTAYVHGYMREEEALERFSAAGRADILAVALDELSAANREMAAEDLGERLLLDAPNAAAASALAAQVRRDAADKMIRLVLQ